MWLFEVKFLPNILLTFISHNFQRIVLPGSILVKNYKVGPSPLPVLKSSILILKSSILVLKKSSAY